MTKVKKTFTTDIQVCCGSYNIPKGSKTGMEVMTEEKRVQSANTELFCVFCMNRYNATDCCPILLSCFHTVCASCHNLLTSKSVDYQMQCPHCRANQNDLPNLNYRMLNQIKALDHQSSTVSRKSNYCDQYKCSHRRSEVEFEDSYKNYFCLKCLSINNSKVIICNMCNTYVECRECASNLSRGIESLSSEQRISFPKGNDSNDVCSQYINRNRGSTFNSIHPPNKTEKRFVLFTIVTGISLILLIGILMSIFLSFLAVECDDQEYYCYSNLKLPKSSLTKNIDLLLLYRKDYFQIYKSNSTDAVKFCLIIRRDIESKLDFIECDEEDPTSLWILKGNEIRSYIGDYALTEENSGQSLVYSTSTEAKEQQFDIISDKEDYILKNKYSGSYLTEGSIINQVVVNEVYQKEKALRLVFNIISRERLNYVFPRNNSTYIIKQENGLCFQYNDNSNNNTNPEIIDNTRNFTNITLTKCNSTDSESFYIKYTDVNSFQIIPYLNPSHSLAIDGEGFNPHNVSSTIGITISLQNKTDSLKQSKQILCYNNNDHLDSRVFYRKYDTASTSCLYNIIPSINNNFSPDKWYKISYNNYCLSYTRSEVDFSTCTNSDMNMLWRIETKLNESYSIISKTEKYLSVNSWETYEMLILSTIERTWKLHNTEGSVVFKGEKGLVLNELSLSLSTSIDGTQFEINETNDFEFPLEYHVYHITSKYSGDCMQYRREENKDDSKGSVNNVEFKPCNVYDNDSKWLFQKIGSSSSNLFKLVPFQKFNSVHIYKAGEEYSKLEFNQTNQTNSEEKDLLRMNLLFSSWDEKHYIIYNSDQSCLSTVEGKIALSEKAHCTENPIKVAFQIEEVFPYNTGNIQSDNNMINYSIGDSELSPEYEIEDKDNEKKSFTDISLTKNPIDIINSLSSSVWLHMEKDKSVQQSFMVQSNDICLLEVQWGKASLKIDSGLLISLNSEVVFVKIVKTQWLMNSSVFLDVYVGSNILSLNALGGGKQNVYVNSVAIKCWENSSLIVHEDNRILRDKQSNDTLDSHGI